MDTEQLKAIALAATPGKWHWVNSETDEPRKPGEWRASLRTVAEFPTDSGFELPKFILEADEIRDENMDANAEFIAAANPATVLELIARIEALKTMAAQADVYRKQLRICQSQLASANGTIAVMSQGGDV